MILSSSFCKLVLFDIFDVFEFELYGLKKI
jgi:hypothetical protein